MMYGISTTTRCVHEGPSKDGERLALRCSGGQSLLFVCFGLGELRRLGERVFAIAGLQMKLLPTA